MTFVKTYIYESEPAIEKLITDVYTLTYHEASPAVHLGQSILWQGRTFRELCLRSGSSALLDEDKIFHAALMPQDRARIMVGSIQGEVFTTPPTGGGELAARLIDRGPCRQEITIRPFHCSGCDRQA